MTDDWPVAQLAWAEAVAYCKWLSEQEKATYRLPTEAEWEYACRAGTTTQYSFGDDPAELEKYGTFQVFDWRLPVVGRKRPNPFGLFDMHGSPAEWCQDAYDEKWYNISPVQDPQGPTSGDQRVLRGGSWLFGAGASRSAMRYAYPTEHYNSQHFGFRIVRVLP